MNYKNIFNWYALINDEGKIGAAFENIKYQIKTKKKRDKNPNFIYMIKLLLFK
jgi:capsule polysaccharide export protein KpsC/LpsZ